MNPPVHLGGWKAFVQTPLGTLTAFAAVLAVLVQTLAPDPIPDLPFDLPARFALTLIAVGAAAAMAWRDRRPTVAAATVR